MKEKLVKMTNLGDEVKIELCNLYYKYMKEQYVLIDLYHLSEKYEQLITDYKTELEDL